MRFIEELKRRHVFRAAIGYLIASWIIIQVSDIMLFNFSAPGWVFKTIVTFLIIGFPLVLILAWALENEDAVNSVRGAFSCPGGGPCGKLAAG